MKRFLLWVLRLLLVAAVIYGCYELTLYLSGQFDPPVMVGYLDAAEGAVWVKAEALEEAITAEEIEFSGCTTSPESLPDAAQEMCDTGARALVISLDKPLGKQTAQALLELARERGVTLLFAGEAPGEAALGEEDLAWYLGSDPALAGEVLGQQAAMLFREGAAPDLNEDHLLQYAWLGDEADGHRNTLRRFLLDECEHYGVYSVLLDHLETPAEELQEQALAHWAELAPRPEILLCSGPEAARAAQSAAQALGWRQSGEGQTPIPILCAAPDEPTARALVENGTAAGCCYYDLDGVTEALALLAVNAAQREFVARGTELVPNGNEFLLPYRAVEAAG